MVKKLNAQASFEFLCLLLFSVLILYLAISGKYLTYVTLKMLPFLYFTAAVMLVWAAFKLPAVFRSKHRIHASHCLVLLVPILFLLLPHKSLSAATVPNSLISNIGLYGGSASTSSTTQNKDSDASDEKYDDSIIKQFDLERAEDGSINVSDEQFYPWLSEIFTNKDSYEGVTITIKGFVFRDTATMTENEFVPARLLMYCCAADLSPCGIVCEYDGASALEADTWVTVTGLIHVGEYQGEKQPVVTVTSVSPAEKPQDEYVYPW